MPRERSIRLGDAWKAWKKLAADPDDTSAVFEIIDALQGRAGERACRRFAQGEVGRRVLGEKRDLLATLADREALRSLPESSLGRSYAAFMDAEAISADGLVGASEAGRGEIVGTEDERRFYARLRDSHDLTHVVTGYGRDLRGEAALLAFSFAQVRTPGIGFIVAMAWLNSERTERRLIQQGYRRGRRAAWLPGQDWEALLARPLAELREQLGVGELPDYEPVWSSGAPAAAGASAGA